MTKCSSHKSDRLEHGVRDLGRVFSHRLSGMFRVPLAEKEVVW